MASNMEKFSYQSQSLEKEKEKLRSDLAVLEATEGYSKLTPRQQQIIRVSLCIQARAERDMHPNHKNDPWYYDWFKAEKFLPRYKKSLEHIQKWYCHASVAALETGDLSPSRPPNCPKEFFDAAYFEIHQESELKKVLEFFDYPSVVHIGCELGKERGEMTKQHTFLALGPNQKGDIIIWEKTKVRLPYRVTTLSQVYEDYSDSHCWGVRKLR